MTKEERRPHPGASVWPMLPEPDLRRLAADIASHGLRHPVVLDRDGLILDGRNRLAACRIAGVEPSFETYEGDDPAGYILSANNERRHLSIPQRAAATALTLATNGKRGGGKWKYGVVSGTDPANVDESPRSSDWTAAMKRAGFILDHAPELLPEVASGTLALDAALKTAQAAKQEKDQRAELPEDLGVLVDAGEITMAVALRRAALAPSYSERVSSGTLTLDEAEHLATRETRERREAVQRTVDNLRAWLAAYPIAKQMRTSPMRSGVLDALEEYDRDLFLKLEEEAWPRK